MIDRSLTPKREPLAVLALFMLVALTTSLVLWAVANRHPRIERAQPEFIQCSKPSPPRTPPTRMATLPEVSQRPPVSASSGKTDLSFAMGSASSQTERSSKPSSKPRLIVSSTTRAPRSLAISTPERSSISRQLSASAQPEPPADKSEPSKAPTASKTLTALRSFPVAVDDRDEPADERAARIAEIAEAIDTATKSRLERAVLIVLVGGESKLARFVDFDLPKCREGHQGWCDSGRAYGLPQLHFMQRTETRLEQMQTAIRRWRGHRDRCRRHVPDDIAGGFAGYGSGGKCDLTKQSIDRAKQVRELGGAR